MSKPRPATAAGTSRRATKQRWSAAKKAQARKSGTKMTAREERRAAERAAAGETTDRTDRGTRDDRSSRGYDRTERSGRWERPRSDRDGRGERDGRRDFRDDRGPRQDRGYGNRDNRGHGQRDNREGPTRSYGDRDSRGFDDRGSRGYGRRDSDGGERREFRRDDRWDNRRDERPARVDRWGNAQRRDDRGERGGYSGRDSRDARGYGNRNDRGYSGGDGSGQQRVFRRDDREWRDQRGERRDSGERRFDRDQRDQRGDRRDSGERRFDRGDRTFGDRARYSGRDDRGFGGRSDRGDRQDRGGWQPREDHRDERRGDSRGERPWRDRGERFDRGPRSDRQDRTERYERPRGYDRPARRDESAPADFHAERMRRTERPRRVELPEDPNDGFLGLGVPMPIVERLARDGIAEPFPIQKATIPDAISGRDVLGRGRTGSGKTMAFGIPVLTRLAGRSSEPKRPRALIMSPTRELAMQISDALGPLAREMNLRHKLVAGGMPYEPQIDALDRGVDVLIATPGRMNDLVEKGAAALDKIEIVVLDEADLMADMGFLPEVTALLDLVPAGGQRLLFSATLDKGIDSLVENYLTDPVEHSTDEAKASVATMTHHIFLVEPQHKKLITGDIANRPGRTVVFVRTKLGADRVASQLRDVGVFAAALHGGLNQGVRTRILAAFKDGTLPVLVATDVASRGIHVDDVSAVLQVDPPRDHKDYLHRAGRTARAGSEGVVVTLALPHQRRLMKRIATDAGLDNVEPTRVDLGDDNIIAATGAERPSGVPISEERLRAVTDPPKRRPTRRPGGFGGRGRGGYGGRGGGGRGGYGGGRRYEDRSRD